MEDFIKQYFLHKAIDIASSCNFSNAPSEYSFYAEDFIGENIEELHNYDIEPSLLQAFYQTRYFVIYQKILLVMFLYLSKLGIISSLNMNDKFLTDLYWLPEYKNIYEMSGLDNTYCFSGQWELINQIFILSGWRMIIESYGYQTDSKIEDDSFDKQLSAFLFEKLPGYNSHKHDIDELVLSHIEDFIEYQNLEMILFISDRNYPDEYLTMIFQDLIYLGNNIIVTQLNAVIILVPQVYSNHDGIEFPFDAFAFSLSNVLFAYLVSLKYPLLRIDTKKII